MTRIPVHKGIGDHPAPMRIVMIGRRPRIEPSDPVATTSGQPGDGLPPAVLLVGADHRVDRCPDSGAFSRMSMCACADRSWLSSSSVGVARTCNRWTDEA